MENWGVFEEQFGVYDEDMNPIYTLRLDGFKEEEEAEEALLLIRPAFGGELFTKEI